MLHKDQQLSYTLLKQLIAKNVTQGSAAALHSRQRVIIVAVPLQLQFNGLITDASVEQILRVHGVAVDLNDIIQSFHVRVSKLFVQRVSHS